MNSLDDDYQIVYSSKFGKVEPQKAKAAKKTQNVRVRREVKRRGGKTVTVVFGLALDKKDMQALASELKRRFGVGGSVKNETIEIQGDLCEGVIEELAARGYKAKRSGG